MMSDVPKLHEIHCIFWGSRNGLTCIEIEIEIATRRKEKGRLFGAVGLLLLD